MKQALHSLGWPLLLASSLVLAAAGQLKPYTGSLRSPDFELVAIDGRVHRLSDYRGKVVLLQFWATYCSPCRKEMPTMNRLLDKLADRDFAILAVNMAEDPEAVKAFLQQTPVKFPVLLDRDGRVLQQWKVFAAPANFIIGKDGEIRYTLYGGIEWDSPEMVQKLAELAGG
jgi:peroxiredoxin